MKLASQERTNPVKFQLEVLPRGSKFRDKVEGGCGGGGEEANSETESRGWLWRRGKETVVWSARQEAGVNHRMGNGNRLYTVGITNTTELCTLKSRQNIHLGLYVFLTQFFFSNSEEKQNETLNLQIERLASSQAQSPASFCPGLPV